MKSCLHSLFVLLVTASLSGAQVPQMINYQGRVAVGGTNFDGTGQFKFSLVDGTGTATYWSNDGTGTDGGAPSESVSLPVQKGLYSVLLGDATLSNMTVVSSSVFTNADVRLRVWFDDGAHGWQRLDPDQRIAAVGYAMMAGTAQTVPDGSITSAKIAAGAVGSAHLGAGAVGSDQLAAGAAASNLNAYGQSGVASGGVILSTNESAAHEMAGYVKLGIARLEDVWQVIGSNQRRHDYTPVWTDTEMIIWGGRTNDVGGPTCYGTRYLPASKTWTNTSTNGAPSARQDHSAVWTGTEMIVWGGYTNGGYTDTGARYDPATDSWIATPTNGTPSPRSNHTALWTGTEMIIWGGYSNSAQVSSGARYDPATDSWTAISTNGAPSPRSNHTALWTGTEMIIWGGAVGGGRYDPATDSWTAISTNGAPSFSLPPNPAVWTGDEMIFVSGLFYGNSAVHRYDPVSDSWTRISQGGAPYLDSRSCSAIWTGNEMIIWGKQYNVAIGAGGRYDPASDSWNAISTTGGPVSEYHTVVWTGHEMLVCGGSGDDGSLVWSLKPAPLKALYLYMRP